MTDRFLKISEIRRNRWRCVSICCCVFSNYDSFLTTHQGFQWQSQLHPLWHFILLQSEQIFLGQNDAEFTTSIESSKLINQCNVEFILTYSSNMDGVVVWVCISIRKDWINYSATPENRHKFYLPYMSVKAYLDMLKNLFSKLKRRQKIISVDTNTSKESEKILEKKENDL